MKKKFLFILLLFILSFSLIKSFYKTIPNCEFDIFRFEKEFFNIHPDSFDIDFPAIRNKYPNFFSQSSVNYKHDVLLNDTLRSVFDSVQILFSGSIPEIEKIQQSYCNYKRFFPDHNFALYTYVEGSFDFRYPVVCSSGNLFVSLELFLGKKHSFYNSLPEYVKFSHDIDFLPSSCFLTLASMHIKKSPLNDFLSSILYHAKAHYFAKSMIPNVQEYQLFKCPKDKIDWCEKNEKVIWEYMIENEYLFSSSSDLIDRFVSLAPFSKFGLDIDQFSPGSVGVWLGLQILESYAIKNDVPLNELLNETDYLKILNSSGYKPI
tara:strand:- start:12657 stop:13616 length:960 start_codon:yes stop_codon:yes gene_type:complete